MPIETLNQCRVSIEISHFCNNITLVTRQTLLDHYSFGYRGELKDLNYTGYDISAKVCEVANLNTKTPSHKFNCLDYIAEDEQESSNKEIDFETVVTAKVP